MTYDLLTQIVKEQTAFENEATVTPKLKFPFVNGAFQNKEV